MPRTTQPGNGRSKTGSHQKFSVPTDTHPSAKCASRAHEPTWKKPQALHTLTGRALLEKGPGVSSAWKDRSIVPSQQGLQIPVPSEAALGSPNASSPEPCLKCHLWSSFPCIKQGVDDSSCLRMPGRYSNEQRPGNRAWWGLWWAGIHCPVGKGAHCPGNTRSLDFDGNL